MLRYAQVLLRWGTALSRTCTSSYFVNVACRFVEKAESVGPAFATVIGGLLTVVANVFLNFHSRFNKAEHQGLRSAS